MISLDSLQRNPLHSHIQPASRAPISWASHVSWVFCAKSNGIHITARAVSSEHRKKQFAYRSYVGQAGNIFVATLCRSCVSVYGRMEPVFLVLA